MIIKCYFAIVAKRLVCHCCENILSLWFREIEFSMRWMEIADESWREKYKAWFKKGCCNPSAHTHRVWDNKRKFRNPQCALFTSHSQQFEFIVTREQSCRNVQIITWWMWCLRQTSAPDLIRNASTRQPKHQQKVTTTSTQTTFKCVYKWMWRWTLTFILTVLMLIRLVCLCIRIVCMPAILSCVEHTFNRTIVEWLCDSRRRRLLSHSFKIIYCCLFNRFCKSEHIFGIERKISIALDTDDYSKRKCITYIFFNLQIDSLCPLQMNFS